MQQTNEHVLGFVSYDGTRLEGTLRRANGQTRGSALLVHGITSDRDEWGFYSDMASALAAQDISTLRFEYRCHGPHASPLRELTLSGILNDIDAAMAAMSEAAGEGPKYLVGTSFGGGLAALWSAQHPGAIRHLFLCAPVIDYEDDVLRRVGLMDGAHLSDNARSKLMADDWLESDGIEFGRPLINELPYLNGKAAVGSPPQPVTVFHGDLDDDVPLASSERFCRPPGCRICIIPGAGHGFAVPGDDDLTDPDTKANHRTVYEVMSETIRKDELL